MERNPKISVIIPIYNVESYLSRCLTSVVKQTLYDIEIVCVNDGTTDGSLDVLKAYMERDSRIVLVDKNNGGISSAWNEGIAIARSISFSLIQKLSENVLEECFVL